jgi:molybdenum cofactor cytidylyltransferase
MGDQNKLLLVDPARGEALVRLAARAILASGAVEEVVVVTGHERARVERALGGLGVRFAHNPGHLDGMGGSLAAGARAVSAWSQGAFVALGDMPDVAPGVYTTLAAALGEGGATIVAPTHRGRRGHPVLFAAEHFAALGALTGDEGARGVVRGHRERVRAVEVDHPGVLLDVDTPEDARREGVVTGSCRGHEPDVT